MPSSPHHPGPRREEEREPCSSFAQRAQRLQRARSFLSASSTFSAASARNTEFVWVPACLLTRREKRSETPDHVRGDGKRWQGRHYLRPVSTQEEAFTCPPVPEAPDRFGSHEDTKARRGRPVRHLRALVCKKISGTQGPARGYRSKLLARGVIWSRREAGMVIRRNSRSGRAGVRRPA